MYVTYIHTHHAFSLCGRLLQSCRNVIRQIFQNVFFSLSLHVLSYNSLCHTHHNQQFYVWFVHITVLSQVIYVSYPYISGYIVVYACMSHICINITPFSHWSRQRPQPPTCYDPHTHLQFNYFIPYSRGH